MFLGHVTSDTPKVLLECSDCYTGLTVALDFDVNSFRNWKGALKYAPPIVAENAALVERACQEATGYLIDMDAIWPHFRCPDCDRSLSSGDFEQIPLRCPRCSQRTARYDGFYSMVSILREAESSL